MTAPDTVIHAENVTVEFFNDTTCQLVDGQTGHVFLMPTRELIMISMAVCRRLNKEGKP